MAGGVDEGRLGKGLGGKKGGKIGRDAFMIEE